MLYFIAVVNTPGIVYQQFFRWMNTIVAIVFLRAVGLPYPGKTSLHFTSMQAGKAFGRFVVLLYKKSGFRGEINQIELNYNIKTFFEKQVLVVRFLFSRKRFKIPG